MNDIISRNTETGNVTGSAECSVSDACLEEEFVYEEAVARIQTIVERIEKGEIPFSELVKEVKTANGLISRCREYLRHYEKDMMANME